MSIRPLRRVLLLVPVVLAAACEFPTEPPYWEPVFNLPAQTTRISVAELLPDEVGITPDSQAFQVVIGGVTMSQSLSQSCAVCAGFPNQSIPKPAFAFTIEQGTDLPDDLAAATISASAMIVDVANHYGFDPLRPSANPAAERGYIIIEVRNGNVVVARDSVNGATQSLPNDDTTSFTINLAGTIGGLEPLTVRFTMYSPAGDSVTVRPSGSVTITTREAQVRVSNVSVRVQSQSITSEGSELDLSSVDTGSASNVKSAALLLAISNPFGIEGSLTATLTGGAAGPITKAITLSRNATSSVRVSFTAAEIKAILGRTIAISVAGTVGAPLGNVPITPTQVLEIDTRLELVVTTKEKP